MLIDLCDPGLHYESVRGAGRGYPISNLHTKRCANAGRAGFGSLCLLSRQTTGTSALHARLEEIAAEHPEIRVLQTVDVSPEFLNLLLNSNIAKDFLERLQATPGSKTMPQTAGQFVDTMQFITLALDEPDFRIAAGFVLSFAVVMFSDLYKEISRSRFGDAGPTNERDLAWVIGTLFEHFGKMLKTGEAPDLKGRVNVELVEMIKFAHKHSKERLSYRELHEFLKYVGLHVADEEALRVFFYRAQQRGWIEPET